MYGELDPSNALEDLRQELRLVAAKIRFKGGHQIVADEVRFSPEYIQQIRKGTNLLKNSSENREFIKDLISIYSKVHRDETIRMVKEL